MSTELSAWARHYTAKRGMFFGRQFRFYGPEGNLRAFVKQKAFKLKEEITVFADEAQQRPLLRIKARSIMDVSATYDVTDAATGQRVGACRRAGLKSILRDEWLILGENDAEVAKAQEDSMMMAMIRRFLMNLIPQAFTLSTAAGEVGHIKQRFNPFQLTVDVNLDGPQAAAVDPRLSFALVVLLLAIEGRQG